MVSLVKYVALGLGAVAATAAVEERQLHSLPSLSGSSSTAPRTTLATQTGPTHWELTTVFTQPTGCVGGITQYAGDLSTLGYWINIPYPAPGVTLTSCFPPALAASVTAAVDLPPYEQLVCPYQWESFDYNSTYRICCPKYVWSLFPACRLLLTPSGISVFIFRCPASTPTAQARVPGARPGRRLARTPP